MSAPDEAVAADAIGAIPARVPAMMAGPASAAFILVESGFMDPRILVANGCR
jgi:hypothetical protein